MKTKLQKALEDLKNVADRAREKGVEISISFGDEEIKL